MRIFAVACYAVALYYSFTAGRAMVTGEVLPLNDSTAVPQLRTDPASSFKRLVIARWLFASGFVAVAVVMQFFAARFEQLGNDAK